MRTGRPRKPTVMKLIAGKPGHRPLPENEPMPEGDLLTPPSWFTQEQKDSWNYAIENAPLGLLRLLDKSALSTWVMADVEVIHAEKKLQEQGPVVTKGGSERTTQNKDGEITTTTVSPSMVINPWAIVRDKAFLRLMKATSELGFSPTSRSRITLAGAGSKKETNRFSNNAAKKSA